jgi:hypothetical protein
VTTRMTCPLPFFGGTKRSTRSVKTMRPTRSLFLMALKARSAETSATVSTLGRPRCAELLGGREIDEQHHGHLALLGEHLHVGLVHARRDVPVDEAHVVARLVLAHLAEGHAAALEDGVIPTRELLVGEPSRADLDLLQLLDELARDHQTLRGPRPCLEDPADHLIARDLLGLGLVREDDAVPQHVGAHGLDVLGRDVAAVFGRTRARALRGSGRSRRAARRRARPCPRGP